MSATVLREIAAFELRHHLRQPLFWVCLLFFSAMAFGAVTTDAVTIGGAIGNVNRNASFVVMQTLVILSILGVFAVTAFVSNAVYRDFESRMYPVFFTTSMKKSEYLLGRFAGSLSVTFLIFVGVAAAIAIGGKMPWLEPGRVGPFLPGAYLFALLVFVFPNLLVMGAIFFAIASLTRSLLHTYAGMAVFFVLYLIALTLMSDVSDVTYAALIDPFGAAAFFHATAYWTVAEKNVALPPLWGTLLANRLAMLIVAVGVLCLTALRFRMGEVARGRARGVERDEAAAGERPLAVSTEPRVVRQSFRRSDAVRAFFQLTRLEISCIVRGLPFLVILFLGVVNTIASTSAREEVLGTPVYPVTYLMIEGIQGAYLIFALLVLTLYSGETAWRERSLRLDGVLDALPVPIGVTWAAKLASLLCALLLLLTAAGATTVVMQLAEGYQRIEPLLYFKALYLEIGSSLALVVVLAFFVQALTGSKYFGFLLMILYYVSLAVLPALHIEHHLLSYATAPPSIYSDMNGYGHFAAPLFWFTLYWALFAGLLVVATHLLWPRGAEIQLGMRLRSAGRRLTKPVATVAAALLLGLLATGGNIYYNTCRLNPYRTQQDDEQRASELEKKYKYLESVAQPRIVDIKATVDIYPRQREAHIAGTYTLVNKTEAPISDLHVLVPAGIETDRIDVPGADLAATDAPLGYRRYHLKTPLPPGGSLPMEFATRIINRGFVNGHSDTKVVANGTFFDNMDTFPHLGYARWDELKDSATRKKYGLPPVVRMPKIDDVRARGNTYFSQEADWLTFAATVSTDADQIAIAPGYLQREWSEGGRRHFRYEMDAPILDFFAFQSAAYMVKRDRWNDVAIEIYYHADHEYNVDRMIDGVKKSLDYFTASFSPYQHRQLRIVEFPRYQRFAQSFPNTIPYSESVGFITDLRDPEAVDLVVAGTAHEVAHQWWGHQVIGGDVQGSTMLSETLAEYSALMVMEKAYGAEKMRKLLRYELDRYLKGRGGELVEELPLALVENQPYIHYHKGSLVMYALKDYIGEQALNGALSAFVKKAAFQGPPYASSRDLIELIRAAVPPDRQGIIADLFERITLYDLRATEATAVARSDGAFTVKLAVEARKLQADGQGGETPGAVDDWIDVGVLADGEAGTDRVLALEKRHLTQPREEFELTVRERPARAGIDPLNKLIDRNPDDNTVAVAGQ
ncbi:MAG: ABC transporter permease [Candidatus Schekmanbacteria bacterium]|nr:ABC transporter permease [Candidatus Schekmanbacteria bacterium]